MSGKTQSRYQRSYLFDAAEAGAVDVQCPARTAPKSTNADHASDLFLDGYTEIIDDRVNYNGTAVVGLFIDSEQFSTIPKRTYLVTGIACLVPTNYDPIGMRPTAASGTGTFKIDWTNNPAWILYDLLTNDRHGIGEFLSPTQVDKWALYQIGQWCDERVPNGKGGMRAALHLQHPDHQPGRKPSI